MSIKNKKMSVKVNSIISALEKFPAVPLYSAAMSSANFARSMTDYKCLINILFTVNLLKNFSILASVC